jgi:hypothetical protein
MHNNLTHTIIIKFERILKNIEFIVTVNTKNYNYFEKFFF